MHPTTTIVLLGAGNVADRLGRRLLQSGCRIRQVYNRTPAPGTALAEDLQASFTSRLEAVDRDADLYLLALSDSAIGPVARELCSYLPARALVAHTSGAVPSSVLTPYFSRSGVFYPLQTFTRGRAVDFSDIPMCVFAGNPDDEARLLQLAARLSRSVHRIDDRQRAILHVAAVFVNNFTNHLFHIGHSILGEENLPFDLLRPLIRETAAKVQTGPPAAMQTGPAIRNDAETIGRHLQYLEQFPDYRRVYDVLTESIGKVGKT